MQKTLISLFNKTLSKYTCVRSEKRFTTVYYEKQL